MVRVGHAADGGGPMRRLVPRDPQEVGEEPDYRFTLANERTFLAWIRTALALTAGGLGAAGLLDLRGADALGLLLLCLSVATAATAFSRWAANERAMRLGQPLPPSHLPRLMAVGVTLVAVVTAVFVILEAA